MTKNVSVDTKSTQEKKEGKEGKVEEEEYTWKTNETLFYLQENPDCYIVAGGEWHGNKTGGVVGSVDMYFRHILTSQRCESVWDAVDGYACFDDRWADGFEALATHIEEIPQLEKIIRTERSMMIPEK